MSVINSLRKDSRGKDRIVGGERAKESGQKKLVGGRKKKLSRKSSPSTFSWMAGREIKKHKRTQALD